MRAPLRSIEPCRLSGRDRDARRCLQRIGAADARQPPAPLPRAPAGHRAGRLAGPGRAAGLRGLARLRRLLLLLLLLLRCSCSCCAFCCGMATKNCQAISTTADSTMARMVFLLSVIGSSFCRLRPACTRRNAPSKSLRHPLERQLQRRTPAD